MTCPPHPDPETLERFMLGRLERGAMARVEAHLEGCARCALAAVQVADDRLVTLLRATDDGPSAGWSFHSGAGSP
jgi:hypothetical protein